MSVRRNRLTKFTHRNITLSVYSPDSTPFGMQRYHYDDHIYSDGVVRQEELLIGSLESGWDVCVGACGTDINSIPRSADPQRLPSFLRFKACL